MATQSASPKCLNCGSACVDFHPSCWLSLVCCMSLFNIQIRNQRRNCGLSTINHEEPSQFLRMGPSWVNSCPIKWIDTTSGQDGKRRQSDNPLIEVPSSSSNGPEWHLQIGHIIYDTQGIANTKMFQQNRQSQLANTAVAASPFYFFTRLSGMCGMWLEAQWQNRFSNLTLSILKWQQTGPQENNGKQLVKYHPAPKVVGNWPMPK